MFRIIKRDSKTKARLGLLSTSSGVVKTPSYVIVATHAAIKTLRLADIKKTKTQIVISNTYHLWDKALKGQSIKRILKTKIPTMTDSGGFQVFSLAFGEKRKVGKVMREDTQRTEVPERNKFRIKITDKGVAFALDGKKQFLDAKTSMAIQKKLGANIIFAFDEPTSPHDNFKYNQKALERTSRWALESLKYHDPNQALFGIVQGGVYKSLRVKSAKFIGALPFDGFGIGGSYTKKQIEMILKWIIPHLPDEKPRHLLGIGKVEDIFIAVENGVDLFDCVIPTREARHGRIYSQAGYYDIRKSKYLKAKSKLDKNCGCPACKTVTKSKLLNLFKTNLFQAQRLATIHNIYFFNTLLEKIRGAIQEDHYQEFKKKFLFNFRPNSF